MTCDDFHDLYPFRSHYLAIDGYRYHYLDEGTGSAVVMLHGNPSWSFYYRNLILRLRGSYRLIVPDHMGCGLSDKPQHYKYCLEKHIENLTSLLEYLDMADCSLVMHDWGGPIGLGYAVEHSDRVRRLVFFNTTINIDRWLPLRILICKLPFLGTLLIRRLNYFALGAVHMACKQREKMSPAVKSGYLMPYDTYENRIANWSFVQDIPLGSDHPTWSIAQKIKENLVRLKTCPTLVCWGLKDFCFTPAFLTDIQFYFPHSEVYTFPDAGHYVVEDADEAIAERLEYFLRMR